jgi:hypothetical protein
VYISFHGPRMKSRLTTRLMTWTKKAPDSGRMRPRCAGLRWGGRVCGVFCGHEDLLFFTEDSSRKKVVQGLLYFYSVYISFLCTSLFFCGVFFGHEDLLFFTEDSSRKKVVQGLLYFYSVYIFVVCTSSPGLRVVTTLRRS